MKRMILLINLILIFFSICSCRTNVSKQKYQVIKIDYIIGHFIKGENMGEQHEKMCFKTVEHDDLARYDLFCDFGYLYFDNMNFKGDEFYKITSDEFYWSYYYDLEGNPIKELTYFNKAYILLVKNIKDNITGYAIIEIVQGKENLYFCDAEVVESFIFPQINGKYQQITYEYIRELFNNLKKSRK